MGLFDRKPGGFADRANEWMTPERALAFSAIGQGLSQMGAGQPVNMSNAHNVLVQRQQRAKQRRALESSGILEKFTPDERAYLASIEPGAAQKIIAGAMFRPEAEPKRYNVGGALVDANGQVVYRAPQLPTKPSAIEAQITRLGELGMSREDAIRTLDLHEVSIDPITRQVQLVDKSTGKIVSIEDALGTPTVEGIDPLPGTQPSSDEVPAGQPQQSTMPKQTDFSDATGAQGFVAQLGNTISDALGGGLVDPNNERATQAMSNLATRTMVTLADGVAGRPSNFLLEQFQTLTVSPNSIWQGEGRTRERLNQTRDMIADAVHMNRDVMESNVTPTMKAQASQNIARLSRLLNDYDAVILSFGSSVDNQAGNKTKSGMTWEILD